MSSFSLVVAKIASSVGPDLIQFTGFELKFFMTFPGIFQDLKVIFHDQIHQSSFFPSETPSWEKSNVFTSQAAKNISKKVVHMGTSIYWV